MLSLIVCVLPPFHILKLVDFTSADQYPRGRKYKRTDKYSKYAKAFIQIAGPKNIQQHKASEMEVSLQ